MDTRNQPFGRPNHRRLRHLLRGKVAAITQTDPIRVNRPEPGHRSVTSVEPGGCAVLDAHVSHLHLDVTTDTGRGPRIAIGRIGPKRDASASPRAAIYI
jgi:hypothetical protein